MNQLKARSVPVNLRQSGNSDARMLISTRVRKSPYWHLSKAAGCRAYTVYNHMYHPRSYVRPEDGGLLKEYEHLTTHVSMWDVAVERQVQIKGPDALAFTNLLVTRDLTKKCPVNQARYVILCDERGGIISDPVLLRVAEDEFWLSISDSDTLLWARGVNYKVGYDIEVNEIDVAPIQIQGPKSKDLMRKLCGDDILEVRYYGLWQTKLAGMDVVISRTGWSAEVGYEIYLKNAMTNADKLWNLVLEAGEEFNLKVIAPSHIRRLEAGILSYGQDMDLETNPFEVGLDWQVDLSKPDFIGKPALAEIKERGVSQRLVGLKMGGEPIDWYIPDFWIVRDGGGAEVGYVTSAFYSPKLESNIALAMLPNACNALGTPLSVAIPDRGEAVAATVVETPFYDPKKAIPAA